MTLVEVNVLFCHGEENSEYVLKFRVLRFFDYIEYIIFMISLQNKRIKCARLVSQTKEDLERESRVITL